MIQEKLKNATHDEKINSHEKINNHKLITDASEVEMICEKILKAEKFIAIDTEFFVPLHKSHNHKWQLSLIQIAAPSLGVFIFDINFVLLEGQLVNLKKLLQSNDVIKIFHDHRQDFSAIFSSLKCYVENIFDTQIAEMFLSFTSCFGGYAGLVQDFLQIQIDKKYQNDDWSKRPLEVEQLNYAALDVIYLLEVYGKILKKLKDAGRLEWKKEYMAQLFAKKKTENCKVYQFVQKYNVQISSMDDVRKLGFVLDLFHEYNETNFTAKKNIAEDQIFSIDDLEEEESEALIADGQKQLLIQKIFKKVSSHYIKNIIESKKITRKKIDKIFKDNAEAFEQSGEFEKFKDDLVLIMTSIPDESCLENDEQILKHNSSQFKLLTTKKIELDHEYTHVFMFLKYILRKISCDLQVSSQLIAEKHDLLDFISHFQEKGEENLTDTKEIDEIFLKNLKKECLIMKGFRYKIFGKLALNLMTGDMKFSFNLQKKEFIFN